MSKIILELDAYEAGLLIGMLTRETISYPDTKSVLQPILNKLSTECNKTHPLEESTYE